ncbi:MULTISPECIES: type I restriction endonuclease subunit R [unclassified Dolichospermum]|uniref:type I restriction endonuclease subunit R n=1 Tax=unclassified Dolichospermum TaxID=2622029 RepID=UPI00144843B0|nr:MULTISPECIES: type I restriction endonuclease subunit R [unclassified Dolichospermum]MTJ16707.1 type I restriction endonuclease subunit R [Dolichospermum sp. UHCC 0299]MTJ41290.1 type I restriction endonuclease subunit R [Dolichospermum sp. UHCC 0406]
MPQSELELEQNLIKRLTGLGYEPVNISNAEDLKANLKARLEKHNGITLSDTEFKSILNHLDKGNIFDRAKRLRDKMELSRDDGTTFYLEFLNTEHWCQNQYQVTNQITQQGNYKNRYDVTLLINGLPLVQIELKRRGLELKEAFNQINRYQRHSYGAENGLFQYVQIFVISNGVNTRYYANNRKQEFKQTFYWADQENNLITQLEDFADSFLEKCHVSKMICKYIVLHESDKVLMVLRPYQYYAVEAIIERVKDTDKNGYIWHTTGSGKTLTSFKAAQILTQLPKVHKVLFVVDRADLDYQTSREFNDFSPDCVDTTDNTKQLVNQMAGDSRLIVTTIQKLNTAIKKPRHEAAMEGLKDQRIVFIFDECHRSQFGETHKNIVKFFTKAQMFGFTGTPIFADNAASNQHGKRTTKDLFQECLHKYVITNAIADENVLKFSVEYWGKIKRKDGTLITEPKLDREFFENPDRISLIVDWIIANHHRKTHGIKFSAMLCVSNVDTLITYYETFKNKQKQGLHDLRVITIFTPSDNEEDEDANGLIGEPGFNISADTSNRSHSRDKLNQFIADYNQIYKTQHSAKDSQAFYAYYKDISKRMKDRDRENFQDQERADILLVVNMFLTGFDVKKLNTLYVDKNLKYHGLIQAYSRTNRILGELKSQGNIVCFRNLKDNTDQAVILFSDTNASEQIFIEPYEYYIEKFNAGVQELRAIATIPNDVNKLISEEEQVEFVKAFRNLIRLLNVSKSFTEFSFSDLNLDEQTFEDYKSKYLDIYDQTRPKPDKEKESLVEEVDFELELIHRDEINVTYILELLGKLQRDNDATQEDYQNQKAYILEIIGKEAQLRSKRDLLEKFIEERMPSIEPEEKIETVFKDFWNQERIAAIQRLCTEENLKIEAVNQMIADYKFSGKEPLRETVLSACNEKPKLLERKKIFARVVSKLLDIINKFDDAIGKLEEEE